MNSIEVSLNDNDIIKILTDNQVKIPIGSDNKNIFIKFFIKKHKKRILSRVRIRKKLLGKN